MLQHTFCHLPKVGPAGERKLWRAGIESWDDFFTAGSLLFTKDRHAALCDFLAISQAHLQAGHRQHFIETLPVAQHWRFFRDMRHSVAYVDIETSGLSVEGGAIITTIALYDGVSIRTYVHGDNLRDFPADIVEYDLLVTFNGKCFDKPFIERYFLMELPQPHIDLRYVLRSLGYRGGLKAIERSVGIDRGELDGVGGDFAVLLWNEYRQSGDINALETLLAYNVEDVVNLETLMILAFNRKIAETPFAERYVLEEPAKPKLPYEPNMETVQRLRREMYHTYSPWQ